MILPILFWGGVLLGLYPYALYPLLAALMARVRPHRVKSAPICPKVSVLICAFNEARHIEATVRNKLGQDYQGWVDVWVASDASTDGTDEIVARLAQDNPQVHLYRQEPRQGKTAALSRLVERSSGDIIVFSDANSQYAPDTLKNLVAPFADSDVGYVTGSMVYVNRDGSVTADGCSAYMRYENWLRRIETELGSVVGVDGGVDAVRRELFTPMEPHQLPDFVLPLNVIEQGYRVVYAPKAHLNEEALSTGDAEYQMRVRVALRALWSLKEKAQLLTGSAGWLFAWQLISHKLLRYLSFIPLGIAFVAALALAVHHPFYRVLLAFYCLALLFAWAGKHGVQAAPARYAYYFSLLNVASAVAVWRFLKGNRQTLWQPRVG